MTPNRSATPICPVPQGRRPSVRPTATLAALAGLGALASLTLHGCGGNPACVFGPTNCQGGVGGGGGGGNTPGQLGAAAALASSGQWILDGAPVIEQMFPTGDGHASTTPIVLLFRESMAIDTLDDAILIRSIEDGSGFGGLPVAASAHLIADGRMMVLLPAVPLTAGGGYEVLVEDDAEITDLTGQVLTTTGLIGTFGVAATDPDEPALLAQWPLQDDDFASATTEIVAVFDRRIEATTVTDASFDVKVAGADPAFDDTAEPLDLGGPFPISDTRVFTYRSTDPAQTPQPLGALDDAVVVTLSATGSEIEGEDGSVLPETTIEFDLAPFGAPGAATFESTPSDAIGRANLIADGVDDLLVRVALDGAQEDDRLGLFLFGTKKGSGGQLVANFQDVQLGGAGPFDTFDFPLEEMQLVADESPLKAAFADGSVRFAFRLRRGSNVSPVTVMDVDPVVPDVQDPILDTQAPTLVELHLPGGGTDLFRSDLRGLVVTGKADEEVRAIAVTTALGDNLVAGEAPPAIAVTGSGHFIAAPVDLGVVGEADLPLTYEVTVYDRAFNAQKGGVLAGLYTQLGAVGPDPGVANQHVAVRVYDAVTLAPVDGAVGITHDAANGNAFVQAGQAGSDGELVVSHGSVVGQTILTVEHPDYHLFTLHGVSRDRVGVPLVPRSPGQAQVGGTITSTDPVVSTTLPLLQQRFGDTRRLPSASATFAGEPCNFNPFGGDLDCLFGPAAVRPARTGILTMLSGDYSLDEGSFSPTLTVQAFEVAMVRPTAAGKLSNVDFEVTSLLSAPGLPPEELPQAVPDLEFDSTLTTGVDFGSLEDDPDFAGPLRVSIEGVIPGANRTAIVGLGMSYDTATSGIWTVKSAYAGRAGDGGALAVAGAIDPDLFVRVEARDTNGNRSGQRPRLSELPGLIVPFRIFPAAVPALVSPAPGGNAGPGAFDVVFTNALIDAQGAPGMYRVTLTDPNGRRWAHWVVDEPDAAGGMTIHVPEVVPIVAAGLADGQIELRVDTFGWAGFDSASFLWSDVELEHDVFSFGAGETFTKP